MPDRNQLTDIQNILGFLIAGFAGVLGFLELRSTEVSTVLRNDSSKASLIALILLLAVLTAVVSVAVPGYKKVPLPQVVALFLLLLGVGALVIVAIPIGTEHWAVLRIVSLVVGALLVVIAVVIYVRKTNLCKERMAAKPSACPYTVYPCRGQCDASHDQCLRRYAS
jgi:predicted membrane channel-forming protein YqfA (hemolysin III family)